MSDGKIISLLPATDSQKDSGLSVLSQLGSLEFLDLAVFNGQYETITLHVDGKPAVLVVFSFWNCGDVLYVNSVSSLDNDMSKVMGTHTIALGLEAIAKEYKCNAISMHTRRLGCVNILNEKGYNIESVLLTKKI